MSIQTPEAAYDYLSQTGRCPGELFSALEQHGGFTSYTYRVESSAGTYFLKHTATHSKSASESTNVSDNLADEVSAYEVIGNYAAAAILPKIVFFDVEYQAVLLTDALPGVSMTLKDIVHEPRWPTGVAEEVGFHVSRMHGLAAADQPTVRGLERDEQHFNALTTWLSSDLTFNSHESQELIESKSQTVVAGERTLIMGDLAPRNILSDGRRIAIVDLARMSLGSPAFDVGYFAGHVLLNAIEFDQLPEAGRFLEYFRSGYEKGLASAGRAHGLKTDTIFGDSKVFAAGWMHRRTFQPIKPENIPAHELCTVESYIRRLALSEEFGY